MTQPCLKTQILNIIALLQTNVSHVCETQGSRSVLPFALKEGDLGRVDICESATPDCAIEHKIIHCGEKEWKGLQQTESDSEQENLHYLLQFSQIRLNELYIGSYKDLHLCTLHPDIHVRKVEVKLNHSDIILESTTKDLISLLGLSYLQQISINGRWGYSVEIKSGLVEGLRVRAQAKLPLKTLSLLSLSQSYSDVEYVELWDAIFSLPNLDQLEVTVSKQLLVNLKQRDIFKMIFYSWERSSTKGCLKRLSAGLMSQEDSSLVSQFTQ